MKETILIGGNNQKLKSNDRIFPVLKRAKMSKWLCFYEVKNYKNADYFYNSLLKLLIPMD